MSSLRQSTALTALAEKINAADASCRELASQSLARAIDAGGLLTEAKALVPHGDWIAWLARNTRISPRSAQMCMRLHEHRDQFAKNETVAHLQINAAMKLIAEPKKEPAEARQNGAEKFLVREETPRSFTKGDAPEDIEPPKLHRGTNVQSVPVRRAPPMPPDIADDAPEWAQFNATALALVEELKVVRDKINKHFGGAKNPSRCDARFAERMPHTGTISKLDEVMKEIQMDLPDQVWAEKPYYLTVGDVIRRKAGLKR